MPNDILQAVLNALQLIGGLAGVFVIRQITWQTAAPIGLLLGLSVPAMTLLPDNSSSVLRLATGMIVGGGLALLARRSIWLANIVTGFLMGFVGLWLLTTQMGFEPDHMLILTLSVAAGVGAIIAMLIAGRPALIFLTSAFSACATAAALRGWRLNLDNGLYLLAGLWLLMLGLAVKASLNHRS